MMDAMEAILSRRSIRKYTAKAVPGEVMKNLLAAAMSAPSACNRQPWHFVVINDRKSLDAIPTFHPYSKMLKGAAAAILVCICDEEGPAADLAETFWIQDCSAATENILIAAHAIGLGAVWVGIYPKQDPAGFREQFAIPDHVTPFSLVSLGYPAEEHPPKDRYDESKVHRNRWQGGPAEACWCEHG